MGYPVVHFEVTGKDGEKLAGFYSELCGWEIDTNNPLHYGVVPREGNTGAEGAGIGGGVGTAPGGGDGLVTFYIGVPDVGAALERAQSLGGTRLFGPDTVPGAGIELGQFADPEGHVVGLVKTES
jgi:predicted enzyme related to lactoylglutathione lyase